MGRARRVGATKRLLAENGLPNLAQVFTQRRYVRKDNLAISESYFALLKEKDSSTTDAVRGSCRILAAALLGLLCSACSVTRHIPEGQYFLQKVKIEDDRSTPRKERITASDMEKYVRQTPNKRFLGTNFYVWLYEQADPAKDNRWNNWKRKIGQAPVTLDMGLTQKSAENLKVYMDSKGFSLAGDL